MLRRLVEADLKARGRTPRTAYEWGLVAQQFEQLCGLRKDYSRADVILWLANERERGICENSIRTRLYIIRLIFAILEITFPKITLPRIPSSEIDRPIFSKKEVANLITNARSYCYPEHLHYLALSTIYGLRSNELANLTPDDLVGELRVATSKGGRATTHIIPIEIQPYLLPLQPTSKEALNTLFHTVCELIGMRYRKGYCWHAIRRALTTELILANASALNVARFMRWAETTVRREFGMLSIYAQPRQEEIDLAIFKIHPFLPYWGQDDHD